MASKWDQHWNSTKINYDIFKIWAQCFIRSYEKYFGFSKSDIVLDFGAGRGDIPLLIKDKVQKIYLFEKSQISTDFLRKKFKNIKNIDIVDNVLEINEPVSLIIINSVIQYMTKDEVGNMLSNLHKISNSKTKLIISDTLPSNYTKFNDAINLLKTSLKNGFFLKFASNMATSIIYSPKLSLKTSALQAYDAYEIKQLLLKHGYNSIIMERNFTYSTHRYTLYCTLTDQSVKLQKKETITI